MKSLIDSGSPYVILFNCYIYIYIYIIFNALLNVYQQGYVLCNLFFLIFFIFYCVYHIHRKKSTIGKECLGRKGLRLTQRGTGKLVINFINKIRSLWRLTGSFHATNLVPSVTVSPNETDTSDSQNSRFKEQSESHYLGDSPDEILRHLNLKNINRLVIGHLNINSLRHKIDSLKLLVKNSLMSLWYLKQS